MSTAVRTETDRTDRTTHPQWWAYPFLLSLLALALGCSGLPSPLYPRYAQEWHLSPLTITMIFAVYAIGALIAALTVGPISDSLGRKPVLVAALVSILVGLVLFLVADEHTYWLLLVARFLHGAAIGAITVVSGAALLDVAPDDGARNGMRSGVALNVGMAVTIIGAAAAAQWAPNPLRLPYLIVAIIVSLMLVALLLLVEPHIGRTGEPIRIAAPSVPTQIRADFTFSAIGIFTSWSVLGVFLSLYPALTEHATGHRSILFAGVVIAAMAAASALSQRLSARFNPRKTAVVGSIGLIVTLICAVWALHLGSTVFVVADSFALGAAFGLVFGGSLRHLNEVTPADARGRVMSAYYLLGYLAMAVPTITAGALASTFGTAAIFPWFVAVVATMSLVAAALGMRGVRDRPVVVTDIAAA
ncbi:MFS transporter [Gordonia sp. X0973]|uniref:MFS transporter n=1 Tax=Gordonia sp. X0973 TaxID=2742602 RepID=UPI000F541AD5|nr:MFS transporter [Gordonia sp. X0973]QKT08677.1 MFS transporter [Gordonia sp. X0973]